MIVHHLSDTDENPESLAQLKETRVFLPSWTLLAAELYQELGRTDEALATIEAVLGVADGMPEAHRLKGEILLQQRADEEAESCFRRALELAREQATKSFELRAASSLARSWQQQGQTQEARALLEPVYDWFTEGFETADLKDAKALLDALA